MFACRVSWISGNQAGMSKEGDSSDMIQIDESICTMYDYFDIFLGRMLMCREAAKILGAKFKLTANGSKVL